MKYSFIRKIKNKIDEQFPYFRFDCPIFIISPPRAGSTFLFDCLKQFEELLHIDWEADRFWWHNFSYERLDEPSDWVGGEEATAKKQRTLRRQLYKTSMDMHLQGYPKRFRIPFQFGLKPIRYLEKTIANCFHLEFIEKTFSNAVYVFLVRDPRSNISSMIDGWPYLKRFGKPQLTHIIQRFNPTIDHWTYPAPPGWQDIISRPLPEICAWSWQQHIEYPLNFFQKQDNSKVIWVRYEELVADPFSTIYALANQLDLAPSKQVKQYLKKPPLSHTTVSKPARNKWKGQYYGEIISILPTIEDTASKIKYDIHT